MGTLTLATFPNHISSLKNSDWQKLFDIVDQIYESKNFGEFVDFEDNEDGTLSLPYWNPSELVGKYLHIGYEIKIFPAFAWMHWEKGIAMLLNKEQDYESSDIIELCKLLATIALADRFNEGYLVKCFGEGIIKKIIHSLKSKIASEDK